ncbi:FtsK/SpoIIIE family DNA translocase [Helicobacter enhydrae]|nr:DNA translocase FtsK [Helicobacter enhydrae]
MGSWGKEIFDFSFNIFGLLAFALPIALAYATYLYHKDPKITFRKIELCLTSILAGMICLITQNLFLGDTYGVIGDSIIQTLKPFLGGFGIFLLCFLGANLCFISFYSSKHFPPFYKKAYHHISIFAMQGFELMLTTIKMLMQRFKHKPKPQEKNLDLPILQTPQMPNLENLKDKPPFQTHTPPPLTQNIDLTPITPPTPEKTNILPFLNKKKENPMDEKDIKIQEYIVTKKLQQQPTQIKIVDEDTRPQETTENPFSHIDLSQFLNSNLSSTGDLLQKIKQETEPKTQTPQTTHPAPQDLEPLSTTETIVPPTTQSPTTPPQDLSTIEPPSIPNPFQEASPTESPLADSPLQETPLVETSPIETRESPLAGSTPTEFSKERLAKPQKPLPTRPHITSLAENEALLQNIDKGVLEIPKDYKLPPIDLLSLPPSTTPIQADENEIDSKIDKLLEKLNIFKIEGDVDRTYSGPLITTLEFRPAANVKVSRIQNLENDLAMALEAQSIRIQAPIPGKSVVGIEIPNSSMQTIYLREIFESEIFKNSASPLTLALGKDVVGNPFVTDLKKLPHLLIAGTTGSGKSVGVNAMILSLLYRNSPDDLKLLMVDPKMVEFMPYSDLPHLITPIITDPKKAVIGLGNAVKEMERRYTLMSQTRTKEILSYNQKAEEEGFEKFPYFIIIIDELADLMMTAGKDVEYSLARIAQMGRASGMHLIIATQSPRADVLTGIIKTNLPSRLSYKVGGRIDSSIIGCVGAETLLGRGDMLFTPPGSSGLVRLHAPWSSENEVNQIVEYIKSQREVIYDPEFAPEEKEAFGAIDPSELDSEMTELIQKAQEIILRDRKTSASYLQRRLNLGYNKASNIIEHLEQIGFLSSPNNKGIREIL